MRKVLLTLAAALFCTLPLTYAQTVNGCAVCSGHLRSQPPKCNYCPGPGGCACDIDVFGGIYECVPCGCCNYLPGSGGTCTDETGGQCGNESCPGITAPVGSQEAGTPMLARASGPSPEAKKSPVSGSTLGLQELIDESPWLGDKNFQRKIQDFAPYLGFLVSSLQDQLKRRHHIPAREGRTIEGYLYFRDDYTAQFNVTKAGNRWRLDLSPDPQNPDAPNALEILGRNWKLLHHIHGEEGQKVIATGSY